MTGIVSQPVPTLATDLLWWRPEDDFYCRYPGDSAEVSYAKCKRCDVSERIVREYGENDPIQCFCCGRFLEGWG